MNTKRCELYEMAREELQKEFPGTKVRRPTSLFWKTFHPQLAHAFAAYGVLGYVVESEVVSVYDMFTAHGIATDVVPDGRVIIFAHGGASVEERVMKDLDPRKEEIRFIVGCPCRTATPRTDSS